MNPICLTCWNPPMTYGPKIYIDRERITAIEQHDFDDHRQQWRTRIHVMGGETITVCEAPESIVELLK